jgi:hypothetical protein
MSKERLTSAEDFIRDRYNIVQMPNELSFFHEDLFILLDDFAAQEVEAAIAETKKQRDELLYAIQLSQSAEYLKGIAITAITNAQEK